MDVRITVETTFDNGEKRTHHLDSMSRPYLVTWPEGFGLRLEDGKRIVGQIQKAILSDQVDEITRESRVCPTCSRVRAIHDYRSTRVLDTLFGRLRVKAARLRRCSCDARSAAFPGGSLSPLACFFPDRATPKLQRLHAELGSRHSFREAARLMKSFLPCHPPHHTAVRGRLGRIAERLEGSGQNMGVMRRLAMRFKGILRGRKADPLPAWIDDAIETDLAPIVRFARTLNRDIDAIEMQWSNGQAEGQINRLKTLKRAMYCRAGPNLLRARMLPLHHTD